MKHHFEFSCLEVDVLSQAMKRRRFKSRKMKAVQKTILTTLYAASSPCREMVYMGDYDEDE